MVGGSVIITSLRSHSFGIQTTFKAYFWIETESVNSTHLNPKFSELIVTDLSLFVWVKVTLALAS